MDAVLLMHSLIKKLHCEEDSSYVFPEIKLSGLVFNFYIHTSVSDLYIPRIVHLFCCSQPNGQIDRGNTVYKLLTDI